MTNPPFEAIRTALFDRLSEAKISFRREDSLKLATGILIENRLLIGIDVPATPVERLLEIGHGLGAPEEGIALLTARQQSANAVFFGLEDRGPSCVIKMYLEFWDQVRAEVGRTASRAPLLLHLGIKWDTARPGRMEIAQYDCHPMLSTPEIMQRVRMMWPPAPPALLCELALQVIERGAGRNPAASLLYLEVKEEGNPRRSFDINFYKTGMMVSEIRLQLVAAARYFDIDLAHLQRVMLRLGSLPLGHLSGGIDRHGGEFLSIYAEAPDG